MASYKKNKESGKFDVIGTVEEINPGQKVTVTKKDGTTKVETVVTASVVFNGLYDPYKGKSCRIGTIWRKGDPPVEAERVQTADDDIPCR